MSPLLLFFISFISGAPLLLETISNQNSNFSTKDTKWFSSLYQFLSLRLSEINLTNLSLLTKSKIFRLKNRNEMTSLEEGKRTRKRKAKEEEKREAKKKKRERKAKQKHKKIERKTRKGKAKENKSKRKLTKGAFGFFFRFLFCFFYSLIFSFFFSIKVFNFFEGKIFSKKFTDMEFEDSLLRILDPGNIQKKKKILFPSFPLFLSFPFFSVFLVFCFKAVCSYSFLFTILVLFSLLFFFCCCLSVVLPFLVQLFLINFFSNNKVKRRH